MGTLYKYLKGHKMKFRKYLLESNLSESSLSRLWKHNEEHECAALTAFRTAENCGSGNKYSNKDNAKRNKSLLAKLKSANYSVTTLKGEYPEGGKSVTEVSYFVTNVSNDIDFFTNIKKLGEEFDQDSVLLIPQGAINNTSTAYLIGTNHCDNNWIGYGKKETFNKGKLGYTSEIYTSYVNGRPFIFEATDDENLVGNGFTNIIIHRAAKKHWKDL